MQSSLSSSDLDQCNDEAEADDVDIPSTASSKIEPFEISTSSVESEIMNDTEDVPVPTKTLKASKGGATKNGIKTTTSTPKIRQQRPPISKIDDDLNQLMGIPESRSIGTEKKALPAHSSHLSNKCKCFRTCLGESEGCCRKIPVGNSIVLQPTMYQRFSCCIVGPHWYGCLVTLAMILSLSYYFTMKAYHQIGIISAVLNIIWTSMELIFLFLVSCSDPGIVRQDNDDELALVSRKDGYKGVKTLQDDDWRYCDLCSVYQPPNAVHCPDCNACIVGYDHHCPWMGTCIGKENIKSFVRFNLAWVTHLLYAFLWIGLIGPNIFHNH